VKNPKNPKRFVFSRRPPDLPDELPPTADTDILFPGTPAVGMSAGQDISIADRLIEGARWEKRKAGTLRIEGSVLNKVVLAESTFGSITCKDVRFVACDLANVETRGLSLLRVEFIDCRMTGFRGGEADCQDVLIQEGDQRYSRFRFSRFKSCEFVSCNFEESDLQGADLSGAIFRRCNLRNTEMNKAKLVNADLRGSLVEGLQINPEDLRGAVVDPA
jgi:uncharacterized protein YjbI with pentapeptide repeats